MGRCGRLGVEKDGGRGGEGGERGERGVGIVGEGKGDEGGNGKGIGDLARFVIGRGGLNRRRRER